MNNSDSKNTLKNAETHSGKLVFTLGHSNLEPLKPLLSGLTPEQREENTAAFIAGCGTRFWWPDEPTAITLTPTLRGCSSVVTQTPTSTIPCHVRLGPALTNPAELTYAEAVAGHLSSECGRAVAVAELEGFVLYLWSENETDGRTLAEYLGPQPRPLQGLLLQARTLEGQPEPLARAELLPFVGKRFEILVSR